MFQNTIKPTGGGAGSAVPYVPSASPFADAAARDAWGAANLGELYNSSSRYTVIEVGAEVERWAGTDQPTSYDNSFWLPEAGNETGESIKNKLEGLSGANRLSATAIKDLPDATVGMLPKLQAVAVAEGLSHGDAFSQSGANDFITGIGIPAEFVTGGGYQLPDYYNQNNDIGFATQGGGDDPTNPNNNFTVIRIPQEYISESFELRIISKSWGTSGSRQIFVYDGNATAGGTACTITRGQTAYFDTANPTTRFWDIPSGSDDLYIYLSQAEVFDVAVVSKAIRYDTELAVSNVANIANLLETNFDLAENAQLNIAGANQTLASLGVSAYWRTTNSRELPHVRYASTWLGLSCYGQAGNDPTTDVQICEFVIPVDRVSNSQVMTIAAGAWNSNGGAIQVYFGDPTSGGTLLTPIAGDGAIAANGQEVTQWRLGTGTAADMNASAIHVSLMGVVLQSVEISFRDENAVLDSDLEEIRGGARPTQFNASNPYNQGDRVYRIATNRSYFCLQDIPAKAWDDNDWQEESVESHGELINTLTLQNTNQENEIIALRGDSAYPAFDPTSPYVGGSKVQYQGRNYIARQNIPAAPWNPANWYELSVNNNAQPSTVRDRLQTLSGTDRLASSAIQFTNDTQVIYVSNTGDNANTGLNPNAPVETITNALTKAYALPSTTKRVVACLDASVFSQVLVISQPVDIYMPLATVGGTLQATANGRVRVDIGIFNGNIELYAFDHFYFGQLAGDVVLGNMNPADSHLHIEDWVSGSFTTIAATAGTASFDIIHNPAGATLPTVAGFTPQGRIGDRWIGAVNTITAGTNITLGGTDENPVINSVGGNPHDRADLVNFGQAGNGWYDLIVWPANQAGTSDTSGADFIFFIATAAGTLVTQRINANIPRGIAANNADAMMRIVGRISNGVGGMNSQAYWRVIRDSSDVDDVIRLQVEIDSGSVYNGLMASQLPLPYDSGVNFGSGQLYTPTGNEVELVTLEVNNWKSRNVVDGASGGIACSSVGEHGSTQQAYIDFTNSTVDIHAGDVVVQRSQSTGHRFTAGEFGAWVVNSPDNPFATDGTFPSLTNIGRTDPDDTTRNPFGNVVLTGTTTGITWRGFTQPVGPNLNRLQWDNIGNSSFVRLNYSGAGVVAGSQLTGALTYQMISNNPDDDEVFELRLGSVTGTVIATINIPETDVGERTFPFTHTVTAAEHAAGQVDIYIVQTAGSTQATNRSGLAAYTIGVASIEPDLQTNVVAQFDSRTRGVLLPRIAPVTSAQHTAGTIALNGADINQPIFYNGDDWSQMMIIRNDTADAQYGSYYDSSTGDGRPDSQGWTVDDDTGWEVVQNQNGFPQLLRYQSGTGTANNVQFTTATANTDAFWEAARQRGFIVTWRARFNEMSSTMHNAIEPRNGAAAGNWPVGRFVVNFEIRNSTPSMVWDDGSATQSVAIPLSEMHTVNLIVPPNSDEGTLVLNGKAVGTCSMLRGGDFDRGFLSIYGNSATRDAYLEQMQITVMEADAVDHTFTRKEITDAIRYVVPTTANQFTLTVPSGSFPVGATFRVVNGGSREVLIQGATGDNQLFGGDKVGRIPAGTECKIVQTGFPRGSIWAMSNKSTQRTPTSNGKDARFNVTGSSLTVHALHGTYSGTIAVNRGAQPAGDYRIVPDNLDDHIFGITNTYFTAKLLNAPRGYEIECNFGLGFPIVRVYDNNGLLVDHDFSVELAW